MTKENICRVSAYMNARFGRDFPCVDYVALSRELLSHHPMESILSDNVAEVPNAVRRFCVA